MTIDFAPSGTVEIPEIPWKEEVHLPADRTALIIVDMQNDFVKEDGALVVPAAIETVPNIKRLLDAARQNGVRIAYTQDTAVKDDPEFSIWPEHCMRGTWGWEIILELNRSQMISFV